MKRVIGVVMLLLAACTTPYYPAIDNPEINVTATDRDIISWIDQRLVEEYYWLDEVAEVKGSFNRNVEWEGYLASALQQLTTNSDDSHYDQQGRRLFYSYIREVSSTTSRAAAKEGYGIRLYNAVVSFNSGDYGFLVDYTFPDSPAMKAGVRRGDIVCTINGSPINQDNYATLFNSIQTNTIASLRLGLMRQVVGEGESAEYSVALDKGLYAETPLLYCDVIDVEEIDMRLGYVVYTSFDRDYDDVLHAALRSLAERGFDHLVLDLRNNIGGSVDSVVELVSGLLGQQYEMEVVCELRRNPRNQRSAAPTVCRLKNVGYSLDIDSISIICSENTASAAELTIVGLRGLGIPVRLIGTQTEGKNCGMDVARRQIGSTMLEYAPITFMCVNGKGFGDYGDGLLPDEGMTVTEDNILGKKDKYYPMPHSYWGDTDNDIALRVLVAALGGGCEQSTTRTTVDCRELLQLAPDATLEREASALYHYVE